MSWSVLSTALVAGLLSAACGESEDAKSAVDGNQVWFVEDAVTAGIDFLHSIGESRRYWIPETIAGGVGLFDKDGDGDLDLYCVQAGSLTEEGLSAASHANKLYENNGKGLFRDVTTEAGVGDTGYGIGCTAGDYDADGDIDLYVTNLGPNVLYRNRGDGTFEDVSHASGAANPGWGASCAFVDFDRDGDLDLFVTNYLRWSAVDERSCTSEYGESIYCGPAFYGTPARDVLLRNDGDDGFVDISEASGMAEAFGNGLGVAWADLDNDQAIDIYVANDSSPNQLWESVAPGRFEDRALLAGCALNGMGEAEAGMGVVLADLDGDQVLDLLCTHMSKETHTLYSGSARGFRDTTGRSGLAGPTRGKTGFGVGAHDFDHDRILDLFIAGGRVVRTSPEEDLARPFAESDQLFRGLKEGRFEEIPNAGLASPLTTVGRGAAFGDIDNDGDIDVIVVDAGGPLRLYRNVAEKVGQAARFHIIERDGTHALGARVMVRSGTQSLLRTVQVAYSYCAANDPAVHVGLGQSGTVDEVLVTWLDGSAESFGPFPSGETYTLRRGSGQHK